MTWTAFLMMTGMAAGVAFTLAILVSLCCQPMPRRLGRFDVERDGGR